ncbi:CHASE domain-containing protein [bacterium]|nr:CHASE domain-containing protein [bacterium]
MVVLILILDVVGTVVAWHFTDRQETEIAWDRFNAHVDHANLAIKKRLLDHELVLRGGLGLLSGPHPIDRQEWRDYIETLKLPENFPGIQGVGFAKWIRPAEKAAHEAEIHAEGFPDYRIWPEGDRPDYTSITYLEPFVKRNLRAFGYDMWSEPVRNAAMSMSRDSGIVSISGKVKLVQETDTDIQHGILMYVPCYRRGAPLETVEERRAALEGFVYSPYRMKDLMRGILGDSIKDIDLEIYDGREIGAAANLFDAEPPLRSMDTGPLFHSTVHLNSYGRTWTLHYASLPVFDAALDRRQSMLVLAIGLFITLILGAHLVLEDRQTKRFERLVSILDATPDIVVIADPTGRPLYLNSAAKDLLGVGREENLAGLHMREFHTPEAVREIEGEAIGIARETGFWRGEVDFLSRKGEIISTLMILNTHRTPAGDLEYFSAVARDIRAWNAMRIRETQLRGRLQEAEKMSALGTTIAGIAHELNNPLTGILGYADLIRVSDDLASCKVDIDEIAKEAGRCAKVIQHLLAFARRSDPKRELCGLNKALIEVLDICSYQMKLDGIDIVLQLDPHVPSVMADEALMKQVFLNLVTNAHHALKETSGPRRLTVSGRTSAGSVQYMFEDTGPGVRRDVLPRIFEPFFTTKGVGKGTGLGLSVSYGIVVDHGGNIRVESEEGRGSVFTVELPVPDGVKDSGDAGTLAEPSEPAPGAASILLVDDEPSIQKTVTRYLGGCGHAVTTAGSVDEAVACLTGRRFDLLIVDFKMPGRDGPALYRHVARHHPDMLGSFVLSTGDVMSDEPRKFVEETAVAVVEKPYNLSRLEEFVRERLAGKALG